MASRRMARSIAGILSDFHSLYCSISSSSSLICLAAPSKSSFAKLSVRSEAAAPFQNCSASLRGSFLLISHWKSICIAYSRDLERSLTLLAPRFPGRWPGRHGLFELAGQLSHFNGGQPGFKSLVAAFQAGSVDRLFQRIAGKHAENHGHAGIHLRQLQAARCFRTNVVVVRGFAAQYAADCDQRVVAAGKRQFFRGQRQLKRAGNVDDVHIARLRSGPRERVHRRRKQAFGDEAVEATDRDRETQTVRREFTADFSGLELVRQIRYGSLSLFPLEGRRTFFQEGSGAFAHVL